ncbi:CHAT domain-containing protein [Russula ochroleuca]|uniref:CHAT domain-containing protein n=1 Tax=Russula ochroleuca TaxID=152965 RepID=A0A9P5MMW6_9AGAM|nr:CHAT domain-containing protein [Russula ochroleuca]
MDAQQLRLHKLATDISFFQNTILSLPRSHPLRVPCVQALAIALFERYQILKDPDDLDQSILRFTEAIFLPLPWDPRCQNIIQIFFSISLALVHRADVSRQPEDVTHSIIYLRYLRGQSLETFNIPPNRVKGLLVDALGIQVEMKLGDVRQDIEEMAVLCHELLKSDIPTTSVTGFIVGLVQAVNAQIGRLSERQEPSDKVIECLREANVRLPDSYEVSIALAWSLFERFRMAYSNDDYEEGMTILDKVTRAPGDKSTQHQEVALRLATSFAQARSSMFGKPEYLEQAIYRTRTLLSEASLEDTLHPAAIYGLALLQGNRFDSGVASAVQERHLRNSGVSDHPSFQDLTASLPELSADNQGKHLDAILSIDRITDRAEVEEAVKYCRLLLASSHHGSVFARLGGMALGVLLPRAFACTNKIEYLNEAISVLRDNFSTQGVQQANFSVIEGLISSLSIRFNLLHRREDFDEIMQLFPVAVNDECARTPDRFLLSCDWARIARNSGHSSTSAAYDCAISLMQDTLTFAPTLDIQHTRLVAMRDRYENLPLDHASYHVSAGQLRQVIETPERGRGLIWSEMRGFRTSIDQIRATDLHLADGFTAVNRDLETLTSTISSNSNDDDGGFVRMDPFGRLVVKQRKLLDDRYKLILQIQALPGLETFLKSPSFDNLHFAAARGPVIIINHCRWRSDILILLHSCSPSLIPTADDFYGRANNLWDQLLGARKEGLDSNQYEDTLCSVLKELYELVGRPVIQRLQELRVPEQSRVWWCPTSVFCSLPLHAMGPIPSDDGFGSPQYFLDLYIPSYTPTLSTLIESNNSGSNTSNKPSILLISQPDASLPGARGEMRAVQATNTQVTTLSSSMATPTTVLERLRDHRFAHIACHGILELGKPFDASFKLYRDKRLSLLDIVRSQLPEAEFAFLSACHTAELTEESIADEALHLAAAMQYCGFRSVVGTMWAMVDGDGRDLARNFYKQVFSGRKQGERYYVRTAEALRDAVKELRRKRGMTLERWVNFVHYGA